MRLSKWLPIELRHMFFSDDGSTAVEVALEAGDSAFCEFVAPRKTEIVALGA